MVQSKGKSMKILVILSMLLGYSVQADVDGAKRLPTYVATQTGFVPAGPLTDVCRISGATGKKIRVLRVEVTTLAGTAGYANVFLIKRSTANTNGDPALITQVPYDSGLPAGSASTVSYSTAPTALGTSIGAVRAFHLFSPALGTAAPNMPFKYFFPEDGSPLSITLNNASEGLAVNFGGIAKPAQFQVNCSFTWTEDY